MSYTIPALFDIDNYLKYSTDTNPTTNDDMQDYMGNQNATLKNLVGGGGLWQPNTEYAQNTVVWSPNMQPNTLAQVTSNGGTTGSAEPSWSISGSTVTDGSITYTIRPKIIASSDIMTDVLLAAHPVGSYYWSSVNTSPAILFGGTWTQIKDRFILAAGTTYGAGATGGAATVALTAAQMPNHNHSGSASTDTGHAHSGTTSGGGGHSHSIQAGCQNPGKNYWNNIQNAVTIAASSFKDNDSEETTYSIEVRTITPINVAGDHTHNFSTNTSGVHSHTITIGYNGSNQAHENMPPYEVAYCWKRTA